MDLFYYGSQDAPLPFRGGSERTSRPRSGTCEACSAAVSSEDLRSGRASEVFGLVLCPECREKTPEREAIELYFCDRCQVSVPVYRVDTGEALAGDGRILCVSCRREITRRRIPWSARLLGLAGLAALALLASGALRRSPTPDEGRLAPEVMRGILETLQRELADLRTGEGSRELSERVRHVVESVERLRAERNGILEELDRTNAALLETRTSFGERMDRLQAECEGIRRQIEKLAREAP